MMTVRRPSRRRHPAVPQEAAPRETSGTRALPPQTRRFSERTPPRSFPRCLPACRAGERAPRGFLPDPSRSGTRRALGLAIPSGTAARRPASASLPPSEEQVSPRLLCLPLPSAESCREVGATPQLSPPPPRALSFSSARPWPKERRSHRRRCLTHLPRAGPLRRSARCSSQPASAPGKRKRLRVSPSPRAAQPSAAPALAASRWRNPPMGLAGAGGESLLLCPPRQPRRPT